MQIFRRGWGPMCCERPQSCLSHPLVQHSCCCRTFWKRSRPGHMLQGPRDFPRPRRVLLFLQATDGAPQRSGPWIHPGGGLSSLEDHPQCSPSLTRPWLPARISAGQNLCLLLQHHHFQPELFRLTRYSLRWLKVGAAIPCLLAPKPSGLNLTGICLHASKPWAALQTSPLTSMGRRAQRKASVVAQLLLGGISPIYIYIYFYTPMIPIISDVSEQKALKTAEGPRKKGFRESAHSRGLKCSSSENHQPSPGSHCCESHTRVVCLGCHCHSSPADWKMSDRTMTGHPMPSARFSGWAENGQALFVSWRPLSASDGLPQPTGQHLLPNKQKSRKQRVSRKWKSGLRAQHKSQWGRGWDPPTSSKQLCKCLCHQYLTSRPIHLVGKHLHSSPPRSCYRDISAAQMHPDQLEMHWVTYGGHAIGQQGTGMD